MGRTFNSIDGNQETFTLETDGTLSYSYMTYNIDYGYNTCSDDYWVHNKGSYTEKDGITYFKYDKIEFQGKFNSEDNTYVLEFENGYDKKNKIKKVFKAKSD